MELGKQLIYITLIAAVCALLPVVESRSVSYVKVSMLSLYFIFAIIFGKQYKGCLINKVQVHKYNTIQCTATSWTESVSVPLRKLAFFASFV